MSVNLRYPNITGLSEKEQLAQLKSYMHQLVEQLQWAFNTIDTPNNSNVVTATPKSAETPNSSLDSQATFSAIKSLIIKSSDIVNAYYEEINRRLEGVYVAESDFGTFVEQTVQDISESSTGIEQNFSHIQQILSDIENINYSLLDTKAHIRTGLLDKGENEVPIYGLEVGQKNVVDGVEVFNKYARFTADRLSFYDQNNTEVAYISDYKLHITHVEVTGSLKLGGYLIDTTKGLSFKWVGRR